MGAFCLKTGDRKGVWKMTKDFLPYGAILTTIIQLQFYNQTYTVYLNRTFQYRYKHHQYADWGENDVTAFCCTRSAFETPKGDPPEDDVIDDHVGRDEVIRTDFRCDDRHRERSQCRRVVGDNECAQDQCQRWTFIIIDPHITLINYLNVLHHRRIHIAKRTLKL